LKNFVFSDESNTAFKSTPNGTNTKTEKLKTLASLGFEKEIFTDGKYDGKVASTANISVENAFQILDSESTPDYLPYVMIRERSGGACGVHVIGIDGSGYLNGSGGSGDK
jgi:hypothetical protein